MLAVARGCGFSSQHAYNFFLKDIRRDVIYIVFLKKSLERLLFLQIMYFFRKVQSTELRYTEEILGSKLQILENFSFFKKNLIKFSLNLDSFFFRFFFTMVHPSGTYQ